MTQPLLPHTPHIDPALEDTLAAVESRLAALGEALRARDSAAIDSHATELHRALARAVDHFTHAARQGDVPQMLRRRLAERQRSGGRTARVARTCHRGTRSRDRSPDSA
jgi:hypothetical protein